MIEMIPAKESQMQRIVTVPLENRTYPIHIGRNIIDNVMDFIPDGVKLSGKNLFILTDENAKPYADKLKTVLEKKSGAEAIFVMPVTPGEESKSLYWYERVLNWMLDSGVTRHSVLFTVGGGVVGDLGGFAAATILRGIPFIQVPTTLLAQVDSGVGGKTAIDMPQGKNLVGAFYQPAAVLCDLGALETLNVRQRLAGYAEIVKYGLIDDELFFEWLEKSGRALCDLDPEALCYAIETSCRKKAAIVAEDELENDIRKLLNLGHTFGHALEASAGYGNQLLHGEAVAIGVVLAASLSVRMGYCKDVSMVDRIREHFQEIGLPTSIKALGNIIPNDPAALVRLMYADKKAETGGLTFVLMHKIGEAFVQRRVPEEDVMAVLKESMHG